jgi:hypothetical protein
MKAFKVSVNGVKFCTAGIGTHGVLSSHVSWVGGGPFRSPEGTLTLHVGGLDSRTREHLRWRAPAIDVGDVVTLEIIETDCVDAEAERYTSPVTYRPRWIPLIKEKLGSIRAWLPEKHGRRFDAAVAKLRHIVRRK